jgi:hypothetical protein
MAGGTKSFEDFASSFGFGAAPSAPEPAKQDMGGFASEMGFSRPQTDAAAPGGQTQPVQQQEAVSQEQPVPEFRKLDRPDAEPMTFAEMGSQALQNVGPSAKAFGESLVQPFLQPKETAQAIGQLGSGLYGRGKEALGFEATPEQKAAGASVDAVGQMLQQRYGSKENAMRTFAEDPVGFFGDVSLLLSGGGGLAARAPGVIGQAGKAVATAGRYTDPLTVAAEVPKAAAKATSTLFNIPASIHSGAAFSSLQAAEKAGVTKNPVFWAHYSGSAPAEDLVTRIRSGVSEAAQERSQRYLAGMSQTDATTALPYNKVDDALVRARDIAMPRNAVFNMESDKVKLFQELSRKIDDWKANPQNTHTIADFDYLKREIRDLGYSKAPSGSPERRMVDEVANAAKDTIVSVDKKYANIMEEYAKASEKIKDMASLISGRSSDTKISKLLRSYKTGDRSHLLDELYKRDPNLVYAIAGHDLGTWLPGGLRGTLTSLGLTGGSFLGGGAGALLHPLHALHVGMISPKVVGGINYGLGRVGGFPARQLEKLPAGTAPALEELGTLQQMQEEPRQQNRGGRIPRASGGRLNGGLTADQLIVAAERAKKQHGKGTESLLDEPDEHITRALEIAKRHI